MDEQEKRNRRAGLLTSLGIHAAVLAVLFFVVAWRAPDPPLPEYGIELNFGLDDQGGGEIQPDKPVGDEGESHLPESVDQPTEATSEEADKSNEEPAAEAAEQAVSKTESPVTVKEEKKVTPPAKEPVKTETQPVKKDAAETASKEAPKVTAPADATKKGDAASQGDEPGKTGDKGSAEGTLDAKALYGTPGGAGGTGTGLQMTGWNWAEDPTIPELPDNENGRIIFEIKCDANGDITAIETIERTLSPRAEQLLKDMIRKNSLVRTSGGKVPEESKGRFVFVLRTK